EALGEMVVSGVIEDQPFRRRARPSAAPRDESANVSKQRPKRPRVVRYATICVDPGHRLHSTGLDKRDRRDADTSAGPLYLPFPLTRLGADVVEILGSGATGLRFSIAADTVSSQTCPLA